MKIYSDDDPVWSAPPTYDDCVRLICEIINQAVIDEFNPKSGAMGFTGMDALLHERYLFEPHGLQADCEAVDMCSESIIAEIKRRRAEK